LRRSLFVFPLLLEVAAHAQPAPVPTPPPAAAPKPPAAQKPPGIGELSDEIRVRAERNGGEKGHFWWEGFVDLQSGEVRIQADRMQYDEDDQPDGTRLRRLKAQSNVVFLRGDERLAGETLEMDLDTNFAVLENASGFVKPDLFVEARKIERVDADTYRIHDARFTSCAQPNPRWGLSASSATIDLDDHISATNVFFKVKSVPALYFPYFRYPIKDEGRASGLLFPHFGFSSLRGFNIGTGFFWAMGRSADQTFYADHFSRVGYGVGHELRWTRDAPSRGSFKSYWFNPEKGQLVDYDLDWNVLQTLPNRFRLTANVRKYSSQNFQQQFQDNFALATNRTQRSVLNLQGQAGRGGPQLQLQAESTDTYFGDYVQIMRRLPALRVARFSQKLGRSQYALGYEARAEYLGRSVDDIVDYWGRVDLAPEMSRSFSNSYLQVTPRLRPRFTWYSATLDEDQELATQPGRSRPFFEGNLEVRGPQFSRIFGGPGFYTDKIKHVLGPEITWTYRTRVDDFDFIPKFDFNDQMLGTNQIDYALVNTLYAKRPTGTPGKTAAYQFLIWRLMQSYYVQIADNQAEYDPNYTTAYYAPGGEPSHISPLQSRFRVRPTRESSGNFDVEYDLNFKQMRSLSLYANVTPTSWFTVNAGWYVAKDVRRRVERRTTFRDSLRGQVGLRLPLGFMLDGVADYDRLRKQMLMSQARLRLQAQCCGFSIELIRFQYNTRQERQFRFSIDLAGIGSIGNFMGQDAALRNGLAGVY
jgi:LPS-assembly protein